MLVRCFSCPAPAGPTRAPGDDDVGLAAAGGHEGVEHRLHELRVLRDHPWGGGGRPLPPNEKKKTRTTRYATRSEIEHMEKNGQRTKQC